MKSEKRKAALLDSLQEGDLSGGIFDDAFKSAAPSLPSVSTSLPGVSSIAAQIAKTPISAPGIASLTSQVLKGQPALASVFNPLIARVQQGVQQAPSLASAITQQVQKSAQAQQAKQIVQKVQAVAHQAGRQIPTARQILSQPMTISPASSAKPGLYHSGLQALMRKPGATPQKKGFFRVGADVAGTMTTLQVQQALNRLKVPGTPLTEDGASGPKTKQAIKNFQSSKGLSADGVVGPMTAKALQSTASSVLGSFNPFAPARSAVTKLEQLAEKYVPGVKTVADTARGAVASAKSAVSTAKEAASTAQSTAASVRDIARELPSAAETKSMVKEAREGLQEGKEALGLFHTMKKVAPWALGGSAVLGLAAYLFFKKKA